MNIILLSGGSGKRLWPLSNDIRSKQFIKIFKKEDGAYESMLQRVYRQIKQVDTDATVTIATSKTQVSAIHNQLGEHVGVSIEPCRRDTFPAIALATAYLVDVLHIDPSESVVVCPVDPYVEDTYFEALKELSAQADKGEANLILMGIEPTYPSEKVRLHYSTERRTYIVSGYLQGKADGGCGGGVYCPRRTVERRRVRLQTVLHDKQGARADRLYRLSGVVQQVRSNQKDFF